MRIGYDAKRLMYNRRGLGNYSRTLLKALGENYPQVEYYLYSPGDPQDDLSADFRQMPFHLRTPEGKIGWLWRAQGIISDLLRDKIDIYHGLSHEIPYGIHKSGIKTIVTIHDTIAFKYPRYFNFFDRKIYQFKLRYAVEHADIVHCISHSTAEDVRSLFNVPPDKIKVIPPILDLHFNNDNVKAKPADLPESYFLYVGALTTRKNLANLFHAWRKSDSVADLVLIGQGPIGTDLQQLASEYKLERRLHLLKNISYSDLPTYYAYAYALIYISEYEGFGLPLMEAAACACPVITSDTSSMPEVLGEASIKVNPFQIDSIVQGIRKFENMSSEEKTKMQTQASDSLQQYYPEIISKRLFAELYR